MSPAPAAGQRERHRETGSRSLQRECGQRRDAFHLDGRRVRGVEHHRHQREVADQADEIDRAAFAEALDALARNVSSLTPRCVVNSTTKS